MNINWFQDPDHLVYINAEKSLGELEKRLKLPGLYEAANALHAEPNNVGYIKRPQAHQRKAVYTGPYIQAPY